jgi:hypothetical protein
MLRLTPASREAEGEERFGAVHSRSERIIHANAGMRMRALV